MKKLLLVILVCIVCSFSFQEYKVDESRFIIHVVDGKKGSLKFYYKDNNNERIGSLKRLKEFVKENGDSLAFAMNGGMYKRNYSPQGLYIEKGKLINRLDTSKGKGNFYLLPNGVFSLSKDGEATIVKTEDFKKDKNIEYATQSGPMLLINGVYHPKLRKGSKNLHIRNAVGILPNGNIMFAMSKEKVNFYDLATLFKQRGCKQALYLDGFVSRTYLPSKKWKQLDGDFGVIIGETSK
ncbi:phosphodiester glycosidase family protein [Wenyingzhuangia sp. IMCC45574]